MSVTAEKVLADALTLTEEERFELAEALFASINQDKASADPAFLEKIRRRCDEIDSGAVTLVPWEEVRKRSREKISG